MNKKTMATEFALNFGCSEARAREMIEFVFQSLARGLRDDAKVVISNFGTFSTYQAQPRDYTSPNGSVVKRGAIRKIRFKAADNLMEYLRGSKVPVAVGNPRGPKVNA